MKAITLRNLPVEVARRLQRRARERKLSLNRATIELLEEALGLAGKQRVPEFHDLDFLIGTWNDDQAREFDAALAEQRSVDPAAWK